MAGSFMARIRERMEQLQSELQPEAGFDRRAYGYEDEAEEDATFEEVALEEESPWRRPGSDEARAAPEPEPAQRRPGTRAPEPSPPPRAARESVSRTARREAFDPFGVGGRQPGGGVRRDASSPPPRAAPAPGRTSAPPSAAARPAPPALEHKSTRGTSRSRRIRARLRQPESLRELFLLREVIDRPVALRRHFRGR